MSFFQRSAGSAGPGRWRRVLLGLAAGSLSLSVGALVLDGAEAGAAGAATPVSANGGNGAFGGSETTIEVGSSFFITLLPPDPCTPAQVAVRGCIDVVPGVVQVFGLAPVHLVSLLPISVALINQYVATLLPPGPCSIGAVAFAQCRDVIPGVVQTQGLPHLP
jgi:hypothetical protein